MADLPDPTPTTSDAPPTPATPWTEPPSAPVTGSSPTAEVEVGLAAFLPEGVELADEPSGHGSPGEGSPGDVGSGDEAAEGPAEATVDVAPRQDDGIDLDLLVHLEADLDAVGVALAALDDGSYGSCAVCRSPLPADVLAADPVRRACDAHLPSIA